MGHLWAVAFKGRPNVKQLLQIHTMKHVHVMPIEAIETIKQRCVQCLYKMALSLIDQVKPMPLNSLLHTLLATYACGASGDYRSASQHYDRFH